MKQFSIPIVGANYPNKDGGNRRSEIAFCNVGEPIELVPEPRNQYDEHAIAAYSARGFQIGYVASRRAVHLKKLIRDGRSLTAIFQDVASFGAIARVAVDGVPKLPDAGDRFDEDFDDDLAQPDPGDWFDQTHPDE